MRVLLTAFEPFDGTGLNASQEGCRVETQACCLRQGRRVHHGAGSVRRAVFAVGATTQEDHVAQLRGTKVQGRG